MFSPVARYYFADKILGKKPDEVIVMSIMPCIAKKYEVAREELGKDGIIDTDLSLTVRAVSYTHLDVYKRQAIYSSMCSASI